MASAERTHDLAGVVLAAGAGTRLRPLTHLKPKALCPVDNVPLADLAIARLNAVTDAIAVNVHVHRDQMVEHFAGRQELHLSIEEPNALGTAGALGRLRPWIDGRDVVVHNADAWHRADVRALLVEGWDRARMRLLVVPVKDGDGDFGPWRYAGVCLLPWADVKDLASEPSGLYEVRWRDAKPDLDLVPYDGPWFDTGTPTRYLAANLAAAGGNSVIAPDADVHPTARVERSVVWPGATVGPDERLHEVVRAPGPLTVAAPQ